MIIGKDESLEKPFLFYQNSSFFSVNKYPPDEDLQQEEMKKADGPHYVTQTTSSMARSKILGTTLKTTVSIPKIGYNWPKFINQQIHLNSLKQKQQEQLKPFFLTKSKFPVKKSNESKRKAIKSDSQLKIESVTNLTSSNQDLKPILLPNTYIESHEREIRTDFTQEELDLIKKSQSKCNDWLENHVLKYVRSKPGFKILM